MRSRSAATFAAGPVITGALSIAAVPVMAHLVAAPDVGRYYLLQTSVALASMTFGLGLDQAYVREYHSVDDRASLLRATFLPALILAVLVGCAVAFSPPVAKVAFGEESMLWAVLLGLCLALATANRILTLILRLNERAVPFSVTLALPKLTLLVALATIAAGMHASFTILLVSYAVALLMSSALALVISRRDLRSAVTASTPLLDRRLVLYGLPLAGAGVLNWFLTSSAAWFIRWLADFDELGIYSVTVSLAGVAVLFQAMFTTVWAPVAYRWIAQRDDAVNRVQVVARVVLVSGGLLACAVGVASPLVLSLLPGKYAAVPYLLPAAMLPALLFTVAEVTGLGITARRRPSAAIGASLVSAVIAVVLLLLMVPPRGAAGAAFALGVSFFVMFGLRTLLAARLWFPLSIRSASFGLAIVTLIALGETLVPRVNINIWCLAWVCCALGLMVLGRQEVRLLMRKLPEFMRELRYGS